MIFRAVLSFTLLQRRIPDFSSLVLFSDVASRMEGGARAHVLPRTAGAVAAAVPSANNAAAPWLSDGQSYRMPLFAEPCFTVSAACVPPFLIFFPLFSRNNASTPFAVIEIRAALQQAAAAGSLPTRERLALLEIGIKVARACTAVGGKTAAARSYSVRVLQPFARHPGSVAELHSEERPVSVGGN